MPTLTTPHNLLRHGTEAICAYLRSSFVSKSLLSSRVSYLV
jgi:hypothetical protein